jgi:hypothetical protein
MMPEQGCVSLQALADRLAVAGVLQAADAGNGRKPADAAAARNLRKTGPIRRADSDEESDFD